MNDDTTVRHSGQGQISRARETKVSLPCTREQKEEIASRAREAGLSVSNYLRTLLGWRLEEQGARKDLSRVDADIE